MIKHRVTAEFDIEIHDQEGARLLAAQAVHDLVTTEAEQGHPVQGDADKLLDSINVVVTMVVKEILTSGAKNLPWVTIERVKLSNEGLQ